MRTRMFVVGGIALALIIAGIILSSALLVICGVLGLAVTLKFTLVDRFSDAKQQDLYLPTYKKEWEDKKKPR
jgi:hypothetical protein